LTVDQIIKVRDRFDVYERASYYPQPLVTFRDVLDTYCELLSIIEESPGHDLRRSSL